MRRGVPLSHAADIDMTPLGQATSGQLGIGRRVSKAFRELKKPHKIRCVRSVHALESITERCST